MFSKTQIVFIFSLALVFSCSGYNAFTRFGIVNTNPLLTYGSDGVLYKGGGLFHIVNIAGQTGSAKVEKTGESCSTSILWLLAFGDSSINTARKKAGITRIALVEYEVVSFFSFLAHRFCTKVSGE